MGVRLRGMRGLKMRCAALAYVKENENEWKGRRLRCAIEARSPIGMIAGTAH